MIKEFYSAKELLDLDISTLPTTSFGIQKRADKEGWKFRCRSKVGGGREYSVESLPEDVKEYILTTQIGNSQQIITEEQNQLVQNQAIDIDKLKPYQKDVMDARALILSELNQLSLLSGGINNAISKLQDLINQDNISDGLRQALLKANAKNGNKPAKISRATIFNWRKAVKDSGTIYGLVQKEVREADWPIWGDALLKLWQRPQKPTLTACLEQLATICSEKNTLPSYSAAQRFLKKLPAQIFNKGRYGSRELKKFKAYVSRDTSNLWPTAVYTADGHTFDAEIENPKTGKAFRPEITTVIDVYTRKVVGWSVDFSESTNSVYMSLANAIITHGVPYIWYVDNGKGFNNKYFDDEMVGLFARLKIEKKNSIAYNSQARGIGERIHQTIWVKASKNLATYMGADMDAQAKQTVFKHTRKEVSVKEMPKLLMKWADFIDYGTKCVELYNNQPHSSLPIIVDQSTYKRRHMTPTEFWNLAVKNGFEVEKLTPAEIKELYRYHEVRRTTRGLVSYCNNEYFSIALEPYHGKDVAISYDIHNPNMVWVRELVEYNGKMVAGKFICEAQFGGNKKEYFPISRAKFSEMKRAEGRVKRLEGHIADAKDELQGNFIEYQTDIEEFTQPLVIKDSVKALINKNLSSTGRPCFTNDVDWAKWMLANQDEITNQDRENLSLALKKPEVKMLFEAEDVNLLELKEITKKMA